MAIKILLADDQFLILEGIKAILKPEPAIKIVGTAYDGKAAIALVEKLRPDILLIDIEMPRMNGILATKYICKYFPDTKVIVLTSHEDQDYIAEAMLSGASGYLWKGNLINDLKQEIYSFGQGYSGVKAKLLTQTAKKNSTTNVVKYREKVVYFKKYRRNIYQPAINQRKQQISAKISQQIKAANLKTSSLARLNRQKYLRRLIWLLLAIFSVVLSILIF